MIRVRVELISANDGSVTEIARMDIANNGESTNPNVGHYIGQSYVGRDSQALDRRTVSKVGFVKDWRCNDWHVWNLVRVMLFDMGYQKGRQ